MQKLNRDPLCLGGGGGLSGHEGAVEEFILSVTQLLRIDFEGEFE